MKTSVTLTLYLHHLFSKLFAFLFFHKTSMTLFFSFNYQKTKRTNGVLRSVAEPKQLRRARKRHLITGDSVVFVIKNVLVLWGTSHARSDKSHKECRRGRENVHYSANETHQKELSCDCLDFGKNDLGRCCRQEAVHFCRWGLHQPVDDHVDCSHDRESGRHDFKVQSVPK